MMQTRHTQSGMYRNNCPVRFVQSRAGSADIVIYYLIFGACWILFTDMLVSRLTKDPFIISEISIIKGWLFIMVTALLLYVLIKRRVRMVLELQAKHVAEIEERERRVLYANRLYAVLSAVNRSVIRISDQQELLEEICSVLVTSGGFRTAWIGWPGNDGWVVPQARSGDESCYLSSIRISVRDIPEGRGPTGTAIRERKACVCDHIADNPVMIPWRELAVQNGFASSACFPFALHEGSTAGLTIYSTEPDAFCTDEEIRLLSEVADDCAYALQMLHTAKAHQVAEGRLKDVIDNSPAVIYAFDSDGRVLLANAALAALCNMPADQMIGRRREEVGISPESARVHRENDLAVLASGEAQVFEESNLQHDGMHTFLTVKFPLAALDTGEKTLVAGISTDITEHKMTERELHRKNEEIEQFIYTASHDLRSPLVTIKTFMGYLEKDLAEGKRDQLAQDIAYINDAADKMKLLLDELLELSRIGRIEAPAGRVSLREVLGEALSTLAGAISERKADIRLPDTDLMLHGDRRRLYQIWQNLIENAIKYSGDGRIPRIEVGLRQTGSETVFFVRDNGIGIDPRYLDKIFGIFEKLDPKSPGAGMGLSMVQRIVENCGGRVWVESEGVGRGACFSFTLSGAMVTS